MGIIHFLSKYVSRDVLDQIYKPYVRPHLEYGDLIYHKYDPELKLDFTKNLESIQYSAVLAVSGTWRGTNSDKLYEELGWEIFFLQEVVKTPVSLLQSAKTIRDPCIYSLKYLENVPFTTVYVDLVYMRQMLKSLRDSLTRIFKTV